MSLNWTPFKVIFFVCYLTLISHPTDVGRFHLHIKFYYYVETYSHVRASEEEWETIVMHSLCARNSNNSLINWSLSEKVLSTLAIASYRNGSRWWKFSNFYNGKIVAFFFANIMHANKLSERRWRCVYVINASKELNPLKVKKLTRFENSVGESIVLGEYQMI